MSHFTVLVVTDTPDQVGEVLQPFHEYECTDVDDEYVIDVDCTDEVNKWLARELFVGTSKINGEIGYQYNLERAEEKLADFKIMSQEEYCLLKGESISDEIKDWFNYELKDGKWFNHTNPNSKWDWWLIGGRWSGSLELKEGKSGAAGRKPLVMGGGESDGIDQALKGDIDFESKMKGAADEAAIEYDKAAKIIDRREWKTWKECRESAESIDIARDEYNNQLVIKDLKKEWDSPFADLCEFKTDRDSYIKTKANSAISTFAVLKDGKWYERGDMGWWGCVSDEKEVNSWNGEFKDLLDTIPDDKFLTVVDCHI